MLSFSTPQRYFLYRGATDMRKGYNGLCGRVRSHLSQDVMSGDVFIFLNRRPDRIQLLRWDATGFAGWYKVLERGTFELPAGGDKQMELDWTALVLLLDGMELQSVKRRNSEPKAISEAKRYGRAA